MKQINNQQGAKDLCPSCLVKLSLIQSQIKKLEELFFCQKETLNFRETCLYTGMSPSQLYKLTKSNRVPYYKPTGKLLFFNRQELDEWLCRSQTREEESGNETNESNQSPERSQTQSTEIPAKSKDL